MDSVKENSVKENGKNKRKKEKISNLKQLGLERGKIYKFMGRWRKLHSNANLHEFIPLEEYRKPVYKIRKNDFIVLFGANLKECSHNKRKYFRGSSEAQILKKLKDKGYEVSSVIPRWSGYFMASYRNTFPEYSGRLYIGHGERFGWINIVQLTKQQILNQFKKVELENSSA